MVTPNGVHTEKFAGVGVKEADGYVDIGAIVRIAKIKDIKTMIYAFAEVRRLMPNTRLHIMGDVDDEEYYEECKTLIEQLDVKGIIFTGVVNVAEYIKKIDFVILTSISEGQPLSVLEAFAAGRACVTTDVGCCRELLEGSDGFGNAGICVPPMNKEQLAQAMLELCSEPEKRRRMGEAGKRRVNFIQPILDSMNFELVDVEYVKEGGMNYLRAYIDKEGGITVDDCEVVARQMNEILDREDYIPDSYTFEVSSGEALEAVEEIAAEVLPRGYDIEWSGVAREEKESGGQSLVIFAICLVFVYLLLAAQYESLLLPLPVILSLPAGVFGSFLLLYVVGLENNIYAQVALVMLIGLLGKNAILIIEVANQCRKEGVSIMGAAIQGATSRLRPILMTSFAFISGLIPLAVASGAGALGNRSIGTAAAGGMLIGTFVGIFLIPGLYVIFESLATYLKEKKQKANEEEYEF